MNSPLDVTPIDVAFAAVFVALAIAVSWYAKLDEERSLAWASLRAVVQLIAVGYVITLVFGLPLAATGAFLAVMLGFATHTAARRGSSVPHAVRVAGVAIGSGTLSVLAAMIALGIVPLTPRFVIPIAGMIAGNCMSATGITLRELGRDRTRAAAEIEAALALGARSRAATFGVRRRGMRSALGPLIDATKAVGVVALPGGMTGMILAGMSPLRAVQFQMVVFFMLLGATAVSVLIAAELGAAAMMTPDERLLRPDEATRDD